MVEWLLNILKVAALFIIALVVWQVASYIWLGESGRLDTIFEYIPKPAEKMRFACIDKATQKRLSKSELEYLQNELQRQFEYFYIDPDKLPDKFVTYRESGKGSKKIRQRLCNQGVEFNFRIIDSATMYFKAGYTVFEAVQTPASYRQAEYFWILGRWVKRDQVSSTK